MADARRDVAVVGAGVIGLTTALELQRRGRTVALIARDRPAATTSAVAAAIWYPYLAEPQHRVQAWAEVTFHRLRELAADPATGVRMIPVVERLAAGTPMPKWAAALDNAEPLGAGAIRARVPICDTRTYLPWLLRQFELGGGAVHWRSLDTIDDALAYGRGVVCCAGLGARELCGDRDLVPVRGQVVVAAGVELDGGLIDDTGGNPVYVIPRGDEAVLGGSAQRGDDDTAVRTADTERIVADCRRLLPELERATIRRALVGLRPWRPCVRLERDPRGDVAVVHDYGHGGSGFTLAWGCAVEAVELLG